MSYRLFRRQTVGGTLDQVFGFFKDPANLEAITPAWLGFRVSDSSDLEVRLGTRIQYRLKLHGVPLRWESRIAEYQEGVLFADTMVQGPYRRWYHQHRFREVARGVEITDVVDYELPLGFLGRIAHAVVVRRQLHAIFAHRHAEIARRFPIAQAHSNREAVMA